MLCDSLLTSPLVYLQIKWLGFRAFYSVFNLHRPLYAKIIDNLEFQIARIENVMPQNECHIIADYVESFLHCEADILHHKNKAKGIAEVHRC